jgi:archaellum component FlaC
MNRWLGPGLALPLLLVACGQPTTAELETELCTNLAQLETSLAEFSEINAQSSVNELREARQDVAQSYEKVRSSTAAVKASRLEGLEAAYQDLDSTINNISGRETVGDAIEKVIASLGQVQAARGQAVSDLNCN